MSIKAKQTIWGVSIAAMIGILAYTISSIIALINSLIATGGVSENIMLILSENIMSMLSENIPVYIIYCILAIVVTYYSVNIAFAQAEEWEKTEAGKKWIESRKK